METRTKYPRTPHLPWSPGATSDDRMLRDVTIFEGSEVVVTEKMDGENTTLYRDGMHARSLSGASHPSRDWLKKMHGDMSHLIPSGMRICGENLYAVHSIRYESLTSYFQVFSIWEGDRCLSWGETLVWCALLGLETVPVLYTGPWDQKVIQGLYQERHGVDLMEGYVVRLASEFTYGDFGRSVAKYVRAGHVQTDEHWREKPVEANGVKNG